MIVKYKIRRSAETAIATGKNFNLYIQSVLSNIALLDYEYRSEIHEDFISGHNYVFYCVDGDNF